MSVLGTGTWAIRTEQGRKLRYTHASGAKWAQHKAMLLKPGQSYPLACLVAWGSSWTSDALVLTVSFLRFMARCLITLWEGSQPWRYRKTPLSWRHGVSENPESILVTWGCSCFSVSSGHSCSSTLLLCHLAFSLPCWLQAPVPEENVVSSHAVFNKTSRAVLCSLCHQAAPHTVPVAVSFSRHCLRRGWIRMLSAPAAAT